MADSTDTKEHFLGRWARVKQARAQGLKVAEPAPAVPAAPEAAQPAVRPQPQPPADLPSNVPPALPQALPPIESLTKDSDFTPFMQAGVSAIARNAAVKKLFTDPHFNVMDRLDIYIDDYSIPDPLPPGMLEQLEHCKSTLFPQPWEDQIEPVAKEQDAVEQAVADVEEAQEPAATVQAQIDGSTTADAATEQEPAQPPAQLSIEEKSIEKGSAHIPCAFPDENGSKGA